MEVPACVEGGEGGGPKTPEMTSGAFLPSPYAPFACGSRRHSPHSSLGVCVVRSRPLHKVAKGGIKIPESPLVLLIFSPNTFCIMVPNAIRPAHSLLLGFACRGAGLCRRLRRGDTIAPESTSGAFVTLAFLAFCKTAGTPTLFLGFCAARSRPLKKAVKEDLKTPESPQVLLMSSPFPSASRFQWPITHSWVLRREQSPLQKAARGMTNTRVASVA